MAYNLGTAYIRIAPSLQGIQKSVTSELNKAGAAGGDSFNKGFSSKAVAVGTFLGNMATKAFSAVGNAISNSLSSAINRSDELSYRFANAMKNVGIDGESAKGAIDRVSEALIGLPTTTDDAARSIKKLASVTGDVDKASDYFLAFNNAVIAGAAPAERQSEAILQMGEAFARGKPDMKEWRIWMETMPGQLNQVAERMGYGANGAQKLGEDLRRSNVSMEDFMKTFNEMNLEASDPDNGFINLADQAKNAVGGLSVSMTRMRTAVTRGLADIIDSLQGSTNDIGAAFTALGSIAEGLLKGDTDKLNQGIDGIVKAIETIGPRIGGLIDKLVPTLIEFVGNALPKILNSMIKQAVSLVKKLVTSLPGIVSALAAALPSIITTLVNELFSPDTLQKLIDGAVDIIVALADALPDIIVALTDALPYIITSIVEVLTNPANMAKMMLCGPKIMMALLKGLLGAVGSLLAGIGVIMGKMLSKLGELPGMVVSVGKSLIEGLWEGIKNAKDWLINKLKSLCSAATDAIKKFFGIHSPSKVMAEQGKFIAMGLGKGIADNADYATNAMEKMADDVLNETSLLGSQFTTPLTANVGGRGNSIARNINQYNTFNQISSEMDVKEISRSLGFAVETAI